MEKVRRISRTTGKIKLCFCVCLKQQHSSRTQCPANLRKQRSLQVTYTQDQDMAMGGKLDGFEIGMQQIDACARAVSAFINSLDSAHRNVPGMCMHFQDIERRRRPVHSRNMAPMFGQEKRISSPATR